MLTLQKWVYKYCIFLTILLCSATSTCWAVRVLLYQVCTKGIPNKAPQAKPDTDMDIDRKGQAGHLYWRCGHLCLLLQVACRFDACRMLHVSHCLLPVTCCRLHAVCFNSKCCNCVRNTYLCFMFLVPCFCYLPHGASCMLRAAGCMSIDVLPCAAILDDTLHTAPCY